LSEIIPSPPQEDLPPGKLPVGIGCQVEVELFYETGESERLNLEIVPDNVSDFHGGLLGESTPLAKALLEHTAGETVLYRAGDIVKVCIHAVNAGSAGSHKDILERRQAVLREAVRQSDLTNAIIFASAVNNKWGDYDPGAMAKERDETK
jgi:hypothetical protein